MDTPANLNHFWASLLVEELVRLGVRQFMVAPGSRSTPLALAIARHPKTQFWVHFDERGNAFAALGYARATGKPAVWVTTSGTAVANGLPAVVEASMDELPVLLLTADRPPELRETGANQTIRQPGIFAPYVRWQFDLPAPTEEIDPAFVLTTLDQAVYRTQYPQPGPVHLNGMFREPLASIEQAYTIRSSRRFTLWQQSQEVFTRYCAGMGRPTSDALEFTLQMLASASRGVVIAGRLPVAGDHSAITHWLNLLGWPVLVDVLSQHRWDEALQVPVITQAEWFLASPAVREALAPDVVLYLGKPVVSKQVILALQAWQPETVIRVDASPTRLDPTHQVSVVVPVAVDVFAQEAIRRWERRVIASEWLERWRAAEGKTRMIVAQMLAQSDLFTELHVVDALDQGSVAEQFGLYLASSMPVRLADMLMYRNGSVIASGANRGASGIDGLIASAAGFAEGLKHPVVLLIGDLAFLHDINSLAYLSKLAYPVVVVVINNNGGGIFSHLPVARELEHFETLFGTPHGLSFASAASLFKLPYFHPTTSAELQKCVQHVLHEGSSSIIEVQTSREAQARLIQAIREQIVEQLSL